MRISKALGLQNGNAIVRMVPKAKTLRNIYATIGAIDFYSAAVNARRGDGFNTILIGGLCMYFIRQTEKLHKVIRAAQPRYDAIVARAKKIHFKD